MFDPDPKGLYTTICRPHRQFVGGFTESRGFAERTFDMFALFWASVGSLEVPGLQFGHDHVSKMHAEHTSREPIS